MSGLGQATGCSVFYGGRKAECMDYKFFVDLVFIIINLRYFMGPVIIAAGAAGSYVTSNQIEKLKQIINQMVKQHEPFVQYIKKIQLELKTLDMDGINQKLKLINQKLSMNLQTLIKDQQIKLEILKYIDPDKHQEKLQSKWAELLQVLNIIGTVSMTVSFVCATNPATIVVSGVMLVLTSIINFLAIFNNFKEIQRLLQQFEKLKEFYKPGGEFQQDIDKVNTYAFQMIQNFYILVVAFRSMLNELRVCLDMARIQNGNAINNQHYFDQFYKLLKQNPFDDQFQYLCMDIYKDCINMRIQPNKRYEMAQVVCKLLEDFTRDGQVLQKLSKVKTICSGFADNVQMNYMMSDVLQKLQKVTSVKRLSEIKFFFRKAYYPQKLPQNDKKLVQQILQQLGQISNPKLCAAQVVSFFTFEFFADDPTGKTLFGYNLEELYKKMQFVNYVDIRNQSENIIYQPEPKSLALRFQWQYSKQYLQNQFISQHGPQQFKDQRVYMRIKAGSFQIGGEAKPRLDLYYGIVFRQKNKQIDTFFDLPLYKVQRLFSGPRVQPRLYKMAMVQTNKLHQKIIEKQDLSSLCFSLSFAINAFAYPQRVTNVNIEKKENKYIGFVQWSDRNVDRSLFGKKLSCTCEEISSKQMEDIKESSGIFCRRQVEGKTAVVFNFK